MKKILAFTLTLITLAMLCSSCAFTVNKPGKVFSDYTDTSDYIWSSSKIVSALSDKTAGNSYGYNTTLCVFEQSGETTTEVVIYDVTTDNVVHTFSVDNKDWYNVELLTVSDHNFFTVVLCEGDDKVYTTKLYSGTGVLIAEAEDFHGYSYYLDADEAIDLEADLIRFDNAIYKVAEDGTVAVLKEKSAFTPQLPSIDYYNEKYYICISDDEFIVYDASLELASHWEYEHEANDNVQINISVMNNGKCLVQILERLPDDAKKYDFMDEDCTKYALSSLIVNPKNGSERSVNLNYIVNYAYGLDLNDGLRQEIGIAKKYDNIALISYLKDSKLCKPHAVILTNGGRVQVELFEDLPLFDAEYFDIYPVAEGVFAYTTTNDTVMFIDAKGKKIVELDDSIIDGENSKYVVIDGAIYDYTFHLLYDFEADDFSLYSDDLSDSILLQDKNGSIYLYTDGDKTMIYDAENAGYTDDINIVNSRYYYITKYDDDSNKIIYTYYNAKGQKLFDSFAMSSFSKQPTLMVNDYKGAALFKAYDTEGNAVYYRVSK